MFLKFTRWCSVLLFFVCISSISLFVSRPAGAARTLYQPSQQPLFVSRPARATPVPDALKPWIPWVLHGHEEKLCPFLSGDAKNKVCHWPGKLVLDLHLLGGNFTQGFTVDADGWVHLPGSKKIWPQNVKVGESVSPVLERDGHPALWLTKGVHEISGVFLWNNLPEYLPVPGTTALVELLLYRQKIDRPFRDTDGRLWLAKRDTVSSQKDDLLIHAGRKITDDVPFKLVTRMDLDVSGKAREVSLSVPLPEGFVPMSLESVLPARLEKGILSVQVRAGQWAIELTARSTAPVSSLSLPESHEPWPDEEIWVFAAMPDLRVVDVGGADPVDPRHTLLPENWKSLPAYRMGRGTKMDFTQKSLGNENPDPDRLSLTRTLWLDFDGQGLSFRDDVLATFRRSSRLEMNPELDLGRVRLDGEDQLITKLSSGKKGIEVALGETRISAEGRGTWSRGKLTAAGWDADFENINGTLKLPPGWKTLTLTGVDHATNTWFGRWTLLDIFLLSILTIVATKLWGAKWGALTFATLSLTLTENGAPYWLWLSLFVMIALAQAITTPKLGRLVNFGKIVTLVLLAFFVVGFSIDHLRAGLYPALKGGGLQNHYQTGLDDYAAPKESEERSGALPVADAPLPLSAKGANRMEAIQQSLNMPHESLQKKNHRYSQKIDLNRQVQTGYGLPTWDWQTVSYSFGGPVRQGETFRALLIPPYLNCTLAFARVLLLILILSHAVKRDLFGIKPAMVLALLALSLAGVLSPETSHADKAAFDEIKTIPQTQSRSVFPDNELLEQLRARLIEEPSCSPHCAEIGHMRVEAEGQTIRVLLTTTTSTDTAVPIPGHAKSWVPETVLTDSGETLPVLRDERGFFWVRLKNGSHRIVVQGLATNLNEIRLPLALKPHHVEIASKDWIMSGVDPEGQTEDAITLSRLKKQDGTKDQSGTSLPPLVEVRRTLTLGLKWDVKTEVLRLSGAGEPIAINVPLMDGETVLTEGVNTTQTHVRVNLSPRTLTFTWHSQLPQNEKITLKSLSASDWVERWILEPSPLWHVESAGIPMVHPGQNPDSGTLTWRPWPGESVTLNIKKPESAPGPTTTIDRAALTVMPGTKTTKNKLELSIRTSLGGKETLDLGKTVQMDRLSIEDIDRSAKQDGTQVEIPLTPGSQNVILEWTEETSLSTNYTTPKIKLQNDVVNATVTVHLPHDRWVLCLKGPRMGAVVQFWSLFILLLVIAVVLSRWPHSPLRHYQWFLVLLGLSQTSVFAGGFVVLWFAWIGRMGTRPSPKQSWIYDLRQLVVAFVTIAALGILLEGIRRGLLGFPEMHIGGYGSSATFLKWYQDRASGTLPQALIFSLPILIYHLTMMAWGLWLAFSVITWVKLCWKNSTREGVWKPFQLVRK